jgi:F-type H+-transporting ATPase subunit a
MISLAAEPIFYIGSFPITNTFIDTLLIDAILIGTCVYVSKHLRTIPGYFQNIIEFLMVTINDLTESVASHKSAQIFPYFMTFFAVILLTNWSGLIPILGSIGIYNEHHEFVPLVRSASTDLNFTLALALVSIVATHSMSISTLGIKEYLSRFFSFNPFNLFIGLLELVSEFTKIISFSFRLFGNIFVGEVMLGQLYALSFAKFIVPSVLMSYELAVGVIQAVIFGMLTMAFMAILTTPHNAESH